MDYRGVNNVKVTTEDLIAKLKKNRETHQRTYKDAMEGYFIETEKKLKKAIVSVQGGNSIKSISFNVPKDHTKDYDRVISMLEMSQDRELIISSNEYNMYVLDEWISDDEKAMLRSFALSSSNSGLYQ